jgi:hypothetical protein
MDLRKVMDSVEKLSARFDSLCGRRDERKRLYPSYTLKDLKGWVEKGELSGEKLAQVKEEIAARESGASQVRVTPQIEGGKVQTKIGRM